jgi:hypothetical protein
MMGNPRIVRKPDEAEKPRKFSKASAKLLMTVPIVIVPAAKAAANVFSSDKEIKIESKVLNPDFIDFSKVKIKLQNEILKVNLEKGISVEKSRNLRRDWDTLYADVSIKENEISRMSLESALDTINTMDRNYLTVTLVGGKQRIADNKKYVEFDISKMLKEIGLPEDYTFNQSKPNSESKWSDASGFLGAYFIDRDAGMMLVGTPGKFLGVSYTADGAPIIKEKIVKNGTAYFISTNSFEAISDVGSFNGSSKDAFNVDLNLREPIELIEKPGNVVLIDTKRQLADTKRGHYVNIEMSLDSQLRIKTVLGEKIKSEDKEALGSN